MTGVHQLLTGSVAPLAIEYLQGASDFGTPTTYTFAGVNFGAADTNRRIIVAIGIRSGAAPTIGVVTIGGITATKIAEINTGGGIEATSLLAYATVPTGTTGSVVVPITTTGAGCRIAVYRIVCATLTVDGTGTPTSLPLSATLTKASLGFFIGAAHSSAATTGAVWTVATENDEILGGTGGLSVASIGFGSPGAITPTANFSPGGNACGSFAVFSVT